MIDTIVFDFGGVLIDWNPRYLYQNVFDSEKEMNYFLENICSNEWNLEQDRGRTFAEGIDSLKRIHPEHSSNIDLFYSRWPQMIKGEITGSVEILKKLKTKYKLFGLTNWSAETFPIAFEKFDFFKLFDGIVVSGVEKMIKPDFAFYNLLLERYNLNVNTCLFIDDNINNIEAAKSLGFKTIHFENSFELRDNLKSKGIL